MFKNKNNLKFNNTKGLTLIELLVVISIFVIVTGITLFSYGSFNSSISTQNLADDIALTVRKAQGYAIGVHELAQINDNYIGYGIHFTTKGDGTLKEGSNSSFILFADINNSKTYNYYDNAECGSFGDNDECMEILSIKSSDAISEISLDNTSLNEGGYLDITFKRPNPEPVFYVNGEKKENITSVKIKISSTNNPDNGVNRFVTISNTGQISVSVK